MPKKSMKMSEKRHMKDLTDLRETLCLHREGMRPVIRIVSRFFLRNFGRKLKGFWGKFERFKNQPISDKVFPKNFN